jgi:hypothetical protein
VLFGSGSSASGYTTLLTIGGATAYADSWTQYTATVSGTGSGRFVFRYLGTGDTNDFIGIDTVNIGNVVAAVPEPSTYAMFAAGLGLVGWMRRRSGRAIGAGVALAALTLSQGAVAAGQEGMVVVRDADSGQLRAPTAAEFKAMQPTPSASKSRARVNALQSTVKADGTRKVQVGTNKLVFATTTLGADGQLHDACVTDDTVAAAPAPTQNKEHRDAQ